MIYTMATIAFGIGWLCGYVSRTLSVEKDYEQIDAQHAAMEAKIERLERLVADD